MLMNKKLNKDDVYNLSEIDSTRIHNLTLAESSLTSIPEYNPEENSIESSKSLNEGSLQRAT